LRLGSLIRWSPRGPPRGESALAPRRGEGCHRRDHDQAAARECEQRPLYGLRVACLHIDHLHTVTGAGRVAAKAKQPCSQSRGGKASTRTRSLLWNRRPRRGVLKEAAYLADCAFWKASTEYTTSLHPDMSLPVAPLYSQRAAMLRCKSTDQVGRNARLVEKNQRCRLGPRKTLMRAIPPVPPPATDRIAPVPAKSPSRKRLPSRRTPAPDASWTPRRLV
jgi:hypothetical protein